MKPMQNEKKSLSIYCKIFLLIVLVVEFNLDFRSAAIPFVGISLLTGLQLAFILFLFEYSLAQGKRAFLNPYYTWCIVSVLYFAFSMCWALDSSGTTQQLKSLVLLYCWTACLFVLLSNKRDIDETLKVVLAAITITGLYIITKVDLQALNGNRIGANVAGLESWNANDIGMKMSIGFSLALYLMDKSKGYKKAIFLLLAAFFLMVALFSGSRKSILMVVMIAFLYMYIQTKGIKKMQILIVGIVLIGLLYFLIMNYEPLYQVIGHRVENMINQILGMDTSEVSLNERERMTEYGIQCFWEKPVIGYGFANYAVLWKRATGVATYSHNNYIEMLVNGGVVGFCIHYSLYVYAIKNLWKPAILKKEKLAVFLLVVNVVYLIMQWAFVSYASATTNLFLMLSVSYCLVQKNEEKRSKIQKNAEGAENMSVRSI